MSEAECEEWILETIDSLRSRKARPDEERICRLVGRRHGLSPSQTRRELERLLRSRAVVRVSYKGSHSYRNAGKWRGARRTETARHLGGAGGGGRGGDRPWRRGESAAVAAAMETGRSRRSADRAVRAGDLPDRAAGRRKAVADPAGRDRARRGGGEELGEEPGPVGVGGDQEEATRGGSERARSAGDPGDALVGALRELGEMEGDGMGIGEISRLMSDRQRVVTRAQLRTALEREVNQGRIRRTPEGNYTLFPAKRRLRSQANLPRRKTRRTKEVDSLAGAEEEELAGKLNEVVVKQASQDEGYPFANKDSPASHGNIAVKDGPDETEEVSVGKHPPVEPGHSNMADENPVSPQVESLHSEKELQTGQELSAVSQSSGKDGNDLGSAIAEESSAQPMRKTASTQEPCLSQGKESPDVSGNTRETSTHTEGLTHSTEQKLPESSESTTFLQQDTRLTEGGAWLSCDSDLRCEDGSSDTMLLPRLPSATANPKHQLLEAAAAEDSSSNSRHSVSEVGGASCLLTPSASPVEMVPEENDSIDRHQLEENGKSLDATEWSIADVVNYFKEAGFPEQAKAFEDQEIDGKSLLLMKRNDVLTGLEIKLGPALKIYEYHIKVLQLHHFNNEPASC